MADLDDDAQGTTPLAPGEDGAPLLARAGRCARAAGFLVATIGALVLVGGYWLGAARLRSIMPAWPPMRANASIMSLFDGLALMLLARTPLSRRRRLGGLIMAVAAGLVAGLTLIEHASGRDLGIDQLAHPGGAGLHGPFAPRVPLQSATGFLLLSGAVASLAGHGSPSVRYARARRRGSRP